MVRPSSKYVPVLLAVGTFVLGVDSFVLAGLLPAVARDLHVSVAQAGQLTTAFAVAYAVGSPLIATATGRFDRRVVLGGGMAVFLLGMVGQALGPTYAVVLAGRILSALGAAGFQATAYAVVGALAPPGRRARSLATVGAGTSLSLVLGAPIGVLVGQQIGWRAGLWVVAGAAVVSAGLCLALPSVRLPAASLRERFTVLTRPDAVLLLCGTAAALVPLYAVVSYIAPVFDGEADPSAGTALGTSSPVLVALVVFGVAFFTGNRLVGWLVDRWGGLRVITLGLGVTTVALVALGTVRPQLVPMLAALALLGLVGPFQVTSQQARVFAVSGPAATMALGLNGSMIYVGTATGTVLGGAATAVAGAGAVPFAAAAAALVALAFLRATAPERRPAPTPRPATEVTSPVVDER